MGAILKEVTELRKEPEYSTIPLNVQRWSVKRLDDAYQGFFRRVKETGKAGFPRFRSKARWSSFGFLEFDGIRFSGTRLRFKGEMPGGLRVHLHRPLPEGKPLSCVFKRDSKG